MFTGIVTDIGRISSVSKRAGADLRVDVATAIDLASVAIGASIACSGVCLTVTGKSDGTFAVDVSGETVARTAQGMWTEGRMLNLERSLRVGDELGGHIVTGHVDGTGRIISARRVEGSLALAILAPPALGRHLATKGSVAVDGVSLTINAVEDGPEGTRIALNIIPHTAAATTLGNAAADQEVNLEIDLLARYLDRLVATRSHSMM
jgi:riboflavin synthase